MSAAGNQMQIQVRASPADSTREIGKHLACLCTYILYMSIYLSMQRGRTAQLAQVHSSSFLTNGKRLLELMHTRACTCIGKRKREMSIWPDLRDGRGRLGPQCAVDSCALGIFCGERVGMDM